MHLSVLKHLFSALLIFAVSQGNAQSAWPSKAWNNAINIQSSLPSDAAELSGLYWNDLTLRLYCVGDGGSCR